MPPPVWIPAATLDYTGHADTPTSAANALGTGSVGIEGVISKVGTARVLSGAAQAGFSLSRQASVAYYHTRGPRYSDKIAIQPAVMSGSYFASVALNFDPVTGEGYLVRWDLQAASPTAQLHRMCGPGHTYSAAQTNDMDGLLPAYSGKLLGDWLVFTLTRYGDRVSVDLAVCPDNGSNEPDEENPRSASTTAYDYYPRLREGGYAGIAPSLGGGTVPIRRVILYDCPQFIPEPSLVQTDGRRTITLTGIDTDWDEETEFTVTVLPSGAPVPVHDYTVLSPTSAEVVLDIGDAHATITISDGTSETEVVADGIAETDARTVYQVARFTRIAQADSENVTGSTFLASPDLKAYGVWSPDGGETLYIAEAATANKVYRIHRDGTGLTLIDSSLNNPRKGFFLPDGSMLVCEYGAGQYVRFVDDVRVPGAWNQTPFPAVGPDPQCYGGCAFRDPVLGWTVLIAGWHSDRITQWNLDGTFIKDWVAEGDNDLAGVSDLEMDSAGYVWAASWSTDEIFLYDPEGSFVRKVSCRGTSGGNAPHGITCLNDGSILVALETNAGTCQRFGPGGVPWGIFAPAAFLGSQVAVKAAFQAPTLTADPPVLQRGTTTTVVITGRFVNFENPAVVLELSGGTGASITGQERDSCRQITLEIAAGSAVGDLLLTDPVWGETLVIPVRDPSLTADVAELDPETTDNLITLTGEFTTWTPGTPGSPTFTLVSAPAGASLHGQVISGAGAATVLLDLPGGDESPDVVLLDPTTGQTCTITLRRTATANRTLAAARDVSNPPLAGNRGLATHREMA